MRSWRAAWLGAAALALLVPSAEGAWTPSAGLDAAPTVKVLAVPYVPQSGALCGGAAIAMVRRYWGQRGIMAEDYAAWLEPDGRGILTGTMVRAAQSEGWTALPLAGTRTVIEAQLAAGRPVIALLETGADSYHYVVLVAWADGWVIVHDPRSGPFRPVREREFTEAWSGSGRWALLIVPPVTAPGTSGVPDVPDTTVAVPSAPSAGAGCDDTVQAGILLAEAGLTSEAERSFLAAEALCPGSAVPLVERAGLRFRAGDWAGAGRLAEQALALDPQSEHTWRLLAGSRFLAGDPDGALDAWNHLSEPRIDLTRIDGLDRLGYAVVADQLGLQPGRLLTASGFRRARRRLGELPTLSDSRLSFRPLPLGVAQVEVSVLEYPLLRAGLWDVGRAAVRALTEREVSVDLASPTGRGELWTVDGRLSPERPLVRLALAMPAGGRRPGRWLVEGLWERQTYSFAAVSEAAAAPGPIRQVEERRRTAVSFADWPGPDVRLQLGLALERWSGRGTALSLAGCVEHRWAGDHLALLAESARWLSLGSGAAFGAAGLSLRWRSSGPEARDTWQAIVAVIGVTSAAPLALWPGAGTGHGRAPLLRAHPLLDDGVIQGRNLGRRLIHATIERETWFWHLGPLSCGWAAFVDAARPEATEWTAAGPWQVDVGTGLRLKSLGSKGRLRLDLAHGTTDRSTAWSVDWCLPWGAGLPASF